MPPADMDAMNNCVQYTMPDRRGEELASESSHQDIGEQGSFYHDDPQCPCYVCTNGVLDYKCNVSNDDTSTGVEFAVRSFWRLAKTQNDVESPTEGHCRGFHYKLLLHPRGTAGTDSEASHLSVFVEASVQDWYPQYWVFPNVRFELTVVNFKDPKQSVTSWAHWSFSSDATSRGWQKMISHSRLTKASGFMDDEGTVLIRGKADPPYPMLWSNSPLYRPQMMWEYIPNRAQREISADANTERNSNSKCLSSLQNPYPCHQSCTYEAHVPMCRNANLDLIHGDPPYAITDMERERERQFYGYSDLSDFYQKDENAIGDRQMPITIPPQPEGQDPPPLPSHSNAMQNNTHEDSDGYTDINPEDSLLHLQPDDHPGISNNAMLRFLDSVIPAIQPTLDADLLALMTHILYHLREFRKHILMWNPPEHPNAEAAKTGNGIILALQKTFAYMELYPLAAVCKTYKLAGIEPQQLSKYYLYELLPKLPNPKRGYASAEYNDNGGGNNATDKNTPNYESNLQNVKYNARQQKQKKGPWNKAYMPIPFPRPSDLPGYNADGEEFRHPNCCYFDGGRYEWEVKRKNIPTPEESAGMQINKPLQSAERNASGMASTIDGKHMNYKLLPGTLSYSIGDRVDVFEKILPPPPNIKLLLKSMHMSDLQVLETQDQLITLHTEFFTMLLHDLAATKRYLKHKRLVLDRETNDQPNVSSEAPTEECLPWYLRDQTDLEVTCKSLFSGSSESEGLFHDGGTNDIASIYIRCKHSHSLQKVLESTPKTMAKFPNVLFFYLYPAKNAKKGELFDIPLRLDCTCLCYSNDTNEEPFDMHADANIQKGDTAGDNTCGSGISTGAMDYCDYSDEDEEDEEEEDDDEEGEEDNVSDTFTQFDTDSKRGKQSSHIKWYSLYALILREGDIRAEGTGSASGNSHSLLLRPEEDGPWYRIFDGRVEKLSTKMEFTEWKCHRDFFCAAAIYIAEDYIDMLQVGEVDLGGNIKSLNPKLFYETLEQLGITEDDIANPAFTHMIDQSNFSADERAPAYEPTSAPYDTAADLQDESENPVEVPSDETVHVSTTEPNQEDEHTERVPKEELANIIKKIPYYDCDVDMDNLNLVYHRKVGQRHPRVGACCEVHGYTTEVLDAMNEREVSARHFKPASDKEICRRINRVETIRPFVKWLFSASKENTALLNGIKPPADGKMLVKFLQQRERYFEEEFCRLICEIMLKEIGEHMALSSVYKWETDKSCCGCNCKKCEEHCPALLLTDKGRFPGDELKELMSEPSTILFRNIQILRCHLEYFCKDCRNLSLQIKDEQRLAEINEFKATSERSALFLIECIWDACVRYTHDCRTILYLKAISDNPAATAAELGLSKVSTLIKPTGIPTTKPAGSLHPAMEQCRDLFVFDGTLSQSGEIVESELDDYYSDKYDITVTEELRIMRYFAAKYHIPTVSQMRKYLRENHVLVYCLIRPHELVRAYLEVVHPGANIKGEIESLVSRITWNDNAFAQKVSIKSLPKEELEVHDIDISKIDLDNIIGHQLCDIYEELITKMLLHMQDAERGLGTQVYDYIYTCDDVTRIVNAIDAECRNTISNGEILPQGDALEEACTCDALPADCRMSHMLSSGTYFPDFALSRGPFSLDFVEIASKLPATPGLITEFMDAASGANDSKKKQKTKVRKQPMEDMCIIPPLDKLLRDVTITQETAHVADPKLFPKLSDIIKYPNGPHSLNNSGAIGKLRRWGEYNSFLYHQALGYDFNVASGFASMLKLENHDSKATPHPLLDTRNYSEVDALRIKYAYEIGIVTSHDLSGCEGFASEEKLIPTKRLLIFHEYIDEVTGKKMPVRVEHLYWGLRTLLHQQLPGDLDSPIVQANKNKKTKGATKCVCGGNCKSDEYECPENLRWKPLPRDCFILYALRPDNNNPIRRGRRRFTFMQPDMELAHYVDSGKRQVNPKVPDVLILIVGAPISLCTTSLTPFPMVDDTEYPLLLFKWMCSDSVDLICFGAVVCDAKKQLQHYIFEWLLPLVRDMGALPKLMPNEKEDIERYQILEECSIRTVQNVRRWSCAIRKINKRTGDIIIAQVKRLGDSPASLKSREGTEFMLTVRELAELEALEFLPPAEMSEDVHDFIKPDVEPQESVEKVSEDVQKLAKKKKKKAPKTAIPSNKKSTFSKSIVLAEAEPENIKDDANDTSTNDTGDAVMPAAEVVQPSHIHSEETQKAEEHIDSERGEEEPAVEEINIGALVEDALDTVTSTRNVVDRSALERRGLPSGRMQDYLQKLDLPTILANDVDMVTDMCVYMQKVMEEEIEVEPLAELEPSRDQVVITVGPRTKTCVDIMLCMMKSMPNDSLVTGFKSLINNLYERTPLFAACIACYALSAMGNSSISENMKSKPLLDFVTDSVQKIADQSIANCHSVFDDGAAKCTVCSLLMCLHMYSGVNSIIAKQCHQNSDLMFVMNVIREKLTPAEEDDGDESTAEIGFRLIALEQFCGGSNAEQIVQSNEVMKAFKSELSPFGDMERADKFEQMVLQDLKIWWYKREIALANIKDRLDAGKAIFVASASGKQTGGEWQHSGESRPMEISPAEIKCLYQCCNRFSGELDMTRNGDMIHIGLRNSTNGWVGTTGDPEGVIKAADAFIQLNGGRNLSRAVANKAMDAAEQSHLCADLDDIRLWGNQNALVTMSLRQAGTFGKVTTQDVEGVVRHYYARTIKAIPAPPKLPPHYPRVGNQS